MSESHSPKGRMGRDTDECPEARYESPVEPISDCYRSRTITHALTGQIWLYHTQSQSADRPQGPSSFFFAEPVHVRCSLISGNLPWRDLHDKQYCDGPYHGRNQRNR